MTPRTTASVLRAAADMLAAVPSQLEAYVCPYCLGPMLTDYIRCYACDQLFFKGGVPNALRGMVVPMTAALDPSKWYTWLQTYKGGHKERGDVIASLTYEYMQAHAANISSMLGGVPDVVTIVPSKRVGFDDQPFRKVLGWVEPLRARVVQTLRFRPGSAVGRRSYNPDAFEAGHTPVDNSRVLLLEDTWVTGATALSAAGALLEAGANAVAILPVARKVDTDRWPNHPYIADIEQRTSPLDPLNWPR